MKTSSFGRVVFSLSTLRWRQTRKWSVSIASQCNLVTENYAFGKSKMSYRHVDPLYAMCAHSIQCDLQFHFDTILYPLRKSNDAHPSDARWSCESESSCHLKRNYWLTICDRRLRKYLQLCFKSSSRSSIVCILHFAMTYDGISL